MGGTSLVLGALAFSACGSGDEQPASTAAASQPIFPDSPEIEVPPGPPPKELVIKDLKKGRGPAVPPISNQTKVTIVALYKAVDYETKETFEERWDPHNPYETEFDSSLDDAWEQGLPGMKVGGRRELIVPADMSFHEIPLIYVIELLRVEEVGNQGQGQGAGETQGEPQAQVTKPRRKLAMSEAEIARLPKLTIARQSGPPPRQMKVIDLREGTGAAVKKWDAVRVQYFQVLYPEVQTHSRTGLFGPHTFPLVGTIKGWQMALPGMRVGGRRELILPPNLKFASWRPSWGYTPYVSIYVIDLIGVEPPTDPYGDRAALKKKSLGT